MGLGGSGKGWGWGKRIKAERALPAAEATALWPVVGLQAGGGSAGPRGHGQRGGCEGVPERLSRLWPRRKEAALSQGASGGGRGAGGGVPFPWGAKATSTSFEPESNQRPKDDHTCRIYSPPLYQLSYRRVRATKRPGTLLFPEMPQHLTGTPEVRLTGLVGSPFEETGALTARRWVRVRGPGNPAGWLRPGRGGGRHPGAEFQDASCPLRLPSFYKWGPRPEKGEEGLGRGVEKWMVGAWGCGRPGRGEGAPGAGCQTPSQPPGAL